MAKFLKERVKWIRHFEFFKFDFKFVISDFWRAGEKLTSDSDSAAQIPYSKQSEAFRSEHLCNQFDQM